jgi:hypothetical protein
VRKVTRRTARQASVKVRSPSAKASFKASGAELAAVERSVFAYLSSNGSGRFVIFLAA